MCVLLFQKLWQVPREVSMYNSTIYIVFNRTFLYGRFSTCCRIRKSVISTKVIVFYTSCCQLSLHSSPQFLLSIKLSKRFQWPILLELLFFAFKVSVFFFIMQSICADFWRMFSCHFVGHVCCSVAHKLPQNHTAASNVSIKAATLEMTLEIGYFSKHTVAWIFVVDLFELRTNL
jgi:hypothetical protein